MSDARIGFGASFKIGDGASPEVFTALGEVTGISGPSLAGDSIEVTHETSPSQVREFIPGLKDGGEFTLTLNLIKTEATILRTQWLKTVVGNYQVVFPTSTSMTWSFSGFLTAFGSDEPIGDRMTASATFKVAGAPTLA